MTARAQSLQLFTQGTGPWQGLTGAYFLLYVVCRLIYFKSRGGEYLWRRTICLLRFYDIALGFNKLRSLDRQNWRMSRDWE
jgi:hypothetical protein